MTTTIAPRTRKPVIPAMAPARAARGAAWFDDNRDKWWSPIDLKQFSVANSSQCPLAWVYGADYHVGMNRVLREMGMADCGYSVLVDFGFDAPLGPDADRAKYHAALQVAWVKEISDRQSRRRN